MNLNPNVFARAQIDEYDPLFGDKKPVEVDPEKQVLDDSFLVFASGPGARVLQYLVDTYLAKPTMNPALGLLDGTANGWVREGQNSVVRHLMTKMSQVIEQQQRRA